MTSQYSDIIHDRIINLVNYQPFMSDYQFINEIILTYALQRSFIHLENI
jgi:hypothetical protein